MLTTGSFSLSDDEKEVSVNEDVVISVSASGGTSTVSLPSGTSITRTDGGTINVSDLTAEDVSGTSLSGLGTSEVVDGALQWGLDNVELNFNPAITLSIFVGTSFNGQTLSIVRSTSDTRPWVNDGIGPPTTCEVANGLCTFTATKASFYAATHTSTSSTSSDSSSSLSAASASSCDDVRPGSAPTLISALGGVNSVTLTWNKALDPVTYYLVTYGLSAGSQQYGNPNVGGPDTTAYTIQGLSGGTIYYFKVRAGNGCAPGDFSNELAATPTGGVISTPAVGFTEGVLGLSSTDTEDELPGEINNLGIGEVMGESAPTTELTPEGNGGLAGFIRSNLPWITLFLLSLFALYYWNRTRKRSVS